MASRALKRRKGTKGTRYYLPVLYIFTFLGALLVGTVGATIALGATWLNDLPDYDNPAAYSLAQKTRVYAADGTTMLAEFYLENREPVDSLEQISAHAINGTIAIEDERFYEHIGVDPYGMARALVNNLAGGALEGASTITQQFVRSTVLADEASDQTLRRKVREAYIALELEESYSKNELLLMYLNTVNYGAGAYGIKAAARKYFNVDCADLTLAQAATLVGIPQSPTFNNPIEYPDNALFRRNLVLNRMLTNGYIDRAAYDAAVAEPLGLQTTDAAKDGIYAYPYFTSYVRQWLIDKYGDTEVFKGGLTVKTTLDIDVQTAAEEACARKESEVDDDMEVSLVAIDPSTGYIRALVGGKDYYVDQYNLATQAVRSPGSAFKTFTLVAAIENGIDPSTYVNCSSPITIDGWRVENYDGASYGTRTIQSAFAISSNTAFARISTLLTPAKVAEMAQRLGVETELQGYQSITLGAEGVTVKDMASAYATIASGGIRHESTPILSIEDAYGNVLYEPDTEGTRVISQQVAHAAEQVMEGVITGGTGTAARLSSGQVAAGKTGTSEDWHDSYFAGITPQYSVAIWMGCREERRLNSWFTAASTFRYFLDPLLSNQELKKFPMDDAEKPNYRTLTNNEQQTLSGYISGGGNNSDSYGYGSGYGTGTGYYNNYNNYDTTYGYGTGTGSTGYQDYTNTYSNNYTNNYTNDYTNNYTNNYTNDYTNTYTNDYSGNTYSDGTYNQG